MFYFWLMCMKLLKNEFISSFESDSVHHSSTSGYNWDGMMRFTYVNLELISDIEKYQFIENTMRSGISMICKGYVKANNKLMKSYDANKPTSYIIYQTQAIYSETL